MYLVGNVRCCTLCGNMSYLGCHAFVYIYTLFELPLLNPTFTFRSVGPKSIPAHLKLEIIETKGKISPKQLKYLIRYCPNITSIKFKYLPDVLDLKELSKLSYLLQEEVDATENDSPNINLNGNIRSIILDDDENLANTINLS